MDFFKTIEKRYSVRSYKDKPVEKVKLDKILYAADIAPTAANAQPFKIFIAKTKGNGDTFRKVCDCDWCLEAPLVLCVASIPEKAWKRLDGKNYHEVDAAIVSDHIILAATALGLGTCWIANFDENKTREFFNIPRYMIPQIITPIGYANDDPSNKIRRKISELVEYKD